VQWFDTKKNLCDCEADITQQSTVKEAIRGTWNGKWGKDHKVVWKRIRNPRVRHYRERDQAHFWHWKDQKDNLHT
jgi:hypothetical protein